MICPSSMPCHYAISLVFHLPTDADTVPSSKPRPRTQKQMQKEMERLTRELQLMTSQRNELRDHVIFITEGKVDDRYPLFQTSWHCQQCRIRSPLVTCPHLEGNIRPFGVLVSGGRGGRRRLAGPHHAVCLSRGLHSRLLMQHTHLEQKVDLLRQEKKKLRDDWALLMRHVEDLKVLCKNQEENGDVKTQQQQVGQAYQSGYEATAQDKSHLQKELLQEEVPAESHPQQLLKSRDQFYSSNLDSIVE
ncbi:disks large homolog 5-like [Microtus ochrogaster]|uniref:Disks large homolog 5-like n=1 Tax=Microtus ochrogaster TaxID=79684 RepID=A0ABM1U1C7_MICOH|nr:disks large homolog 5-like [Microtus ochrogaster]